MAEVKVNDKRARSREELSATPATPPAPPTPVILAGATEAAVVHPGDALVISFDKPLSIGRNQELRRHLAAGLPGVQVLLLDGASFSVIRGEDIPDQGLVH